MGKTREQYLLWSADIFPHINWRQVEKDSLQLPGLQSRNKLSKGPATDIHDITSFVIHDYQPSKCYLAKNMRNI